MNWDAEKGFDFVLDPVNKRPVKMTDKVIEDYLSRKHDRMNSRLVENEESGHEDGKNVGFIYGLLKGLGVDTTDMDPDECFKLYDRLTKVSGSKKKVQSFFGKTTGTYDLDTGRPVNFDKGYQVTFVRPEAERLSDEDYDKWATYCAKKTGSKAYAGVWDGGGEVSFHCASRKEAIRLMHLFNQDSILDWQKKKKYPDPKDWRKIYIWNRTQSTEEVDYERLAKEIL